MNTALNSMPWLVEATLRGSACIVVVWLLRPVFRRWLGARAAHLLWVAVLAALLSPWLPRSPLVSLRAPIPAAAEARGFENARVRVSVQEGGAVNSPAVAFSAPAAESALPLLFWIWATGAAAATAVALLQTFRAARLVRRAPEVQDQERIASALAGAVDLPAELHFRETDELRSPALCGVLQPTILLPARWQTQLTEQELRCVLLHEIGHLQRGDLLWRWSFVVARVVHWFNPLVWLAARSARADQEMACDEWVCARSSSCDRAIYGEVLLKMVQLSSTARFTAPAHATMAESKIGLTRRIQHLAQIRSHGWAAIVIVASFAAVLLLLLGPGPARVLAQAPQDPPPQAQAAPIAATPESFPAEAPHVKIASVFVEVSGSAAKVDETLRTLFATVPSRPGGRLPSVLNDSEYRQLLSLLNSTKGVDSLNGPSVTTRVRQRAVIEIIREFRYPTEFDASAPIVTPRAFETRNTGITLEVLPVRVSGDRINMVLIPSVVEFLGFVDYNGSKKADAGAQGDPLSILLSEPLLFTDGVINQPVFARRKMSTSVSMKSGQTALLFAIDDLGDDTARSRDLSDRVSRPPDMGAPAAGKPRELVKRSLFILVTARLVTAPREVPPAEPSQPQAPAAAAAPGELPFGTAVQGKPGFITSPHAPAAGYVDVRGFPSGTEIKCPFSGKMFRVL